MKNCGYRILGLGHDPIDRFYPANKQFDFDCILQIDGDDPLVPPEYAKYLLNEISVNKFRCREHN